MSQHSASRKQMRNGYPPFYKKKEHKLLVNEIDLYVNVSDKIAYSLTLFINGLLR